MWYMFWTSVLAADLLVKFQICRQKFQKRISTKNSYLKFSRLLFENIKSFMVTKKQKHHLQTSGWKISSQNYPSRNFAVALTGSRPWCSKSRIKHTVRPVQICQHQSPNIIYLCRKCLTGQHCWIKMCGERIIWNIKFFNL